MFILIYCELLKLKRSKMFILSILSVFSTPVMMFIEALYTHYHRPEEIFTLADIYDSSLFYIMVLTNMMIYVTITAYLFSREYQESTLITILTIPVSRIKFVLAKFYTLLLWIIILTIVTWTGILTLSSLYHVLIGLEGYGIFVAYKWFWKFLIGNILVYLTITPFAFIAEKTKGFVAPVITSAIIVMGSAALSNQDFGALYPWVATYFLINGNLANTEYSILLVMIIIFLVSFIGFSTTFYYFQKEDL